MNPMRALFRQPAMLLLLLLLGTGKGLASQPEPPAEPAAQEYRIYEPIFKGETFIVEAGRQHQTSVVLVHGLGDLAAGTWRHLLPELARSYHVVAFDLPGFGRSEQRNVLYSPGQYAAFVRWVVDRCTEGPVVLVGHSLGGAIALHYAATYPQNLQRLILADVAGILHRAVYTKELLGPKLPDLPGPVDLKGLLGGVVGRLPAPPLDLDFLLGNETLRGSILGGNPAKIAAMALIQEDFSALLAQVQAPTIILWGADDAVTPLRTGLLLEAVLPHARLQVIPLAGHVPMLDQPKLFNRAVLDAIAAPAPDPRPISADVGERVGLCRGETGKTFSGVYERIEISDCRDVRLTDITAAAVAIDHSQVFVEQGEIRGSGVALTVTNSTVTATGLRITGEIALLASGSTLDLAGVNLTGTSAAVWSDKPSTLLFSVCRAQSPTTNGFLHGVRRLTANEAM